MTPLVSPLDGTLFGEGQPCFGCSPDHPFGFRLRFTVDGDAVVTRFLPTVRHQGPLGLMHGGLVSTVADETAAWAVLASTGKFGFTTGFEARLLKGIRVGQEAQARGQVTKPGGRVVRAAVEVRQSGEACFTGDFTFALLERSGAEKLLGGPLPEEWARFCR
ncbi:MAG: PaaI family thioesterase [Myxococcales bacterium]|nr:PaaI family thioesterase [Myxococcales bacterium]